MSGPALSVDSGRQAEPFSKFSQDLVESLVRKRERARYASQGWKSSACAASGRLHFGCCGAGTQDEITALAETHSGRDRAKAHECKHHFEPGEGRHQRAQLDFLGRSCLQNESRLILAVESRLSAVGGDARIPRTEDDIT